MKSYYDGGKQVRARAEANRMLAALRRLRGRRLSLHLLAHPRTEKLPMFQTPKHGAPAGVLLAEWSAILGRGAAHDA